MLLYAAENMFIYMFFGHVLITSHAIRGFISIAVQLMVIIAACRIPKVHGVLFYVLCQTVMFLAEIPADILIFRIEPDFINIMSLSVGVLVAWKIAYFPLFVLAFVVPYWLCTRYVKRVPSPEVSRYLPFLLLQAPMVLLPVFTTITVTSNYTLLGSVAIVFLLVNLLLDFLLMRTFEKINQAHEAQRREEQTRSMLQAQLDYYNQMQDSARATRQLRHDMKNQLQALAILLEDGEYDTAMTQLSAFREKIGQAGEKCHTGNSVVDAVIQSKMDACAERGIFIRCGGSLPSDLRISAVSLCSITANLLDNAIHAVEDLPPEQEITFQAGMTDGRVVFTCENPVAPGTELKESDPKIDAEHGWGLNILRSIAGEYGGEMHLMQQDSMVKAVLWLTPQNIEE